MKKIVTFLFGIISYLVFLAAFLYAIGFVGNFMVPKSIDTGLTTTTLLTALIVNLILLSLFAIQHSVMARPAFKKWWTPIVGPALERSIYVLLASMTLFLMYWKWQPITGVIWEVHNPVLTILLYVLFGTGWLIVLLSTFMINHFELFGLKQVYEYLKSIEPKPVAFKLTLFYSIVRHPIMLGFIIAFWSTPLMTIGHLVFSVTTTLYIIIAITFLEERDLLKMHGEKYKEYQARVPKIIPFT
jgi:protein-S-isoprenylcysteine O-methyltransferase Ste14